MKKNILILLIGILVLVGCSSQNKKDKEQQQKDKEILEKEEHIETIRERLNKDYKIDYEVFEIDERFEIVLDVSKKNKPIIEVYYKGKPSDENFVYYHNQDEDLDVLGYYPVEHNDIPFDENEKVDPYREQLQEQYHDTLQDLGIEENEVIALAIEYIELETIEKE